MKQSNTIKPERRRLPARRRTATRRCARTSTPPPAGSRSTRNKTRSSPDIEQAIADKFPRRPRREQDVVVTKDGRGRHRGDGSVEDASAPQPGRRGGPRRRGRRTGRPEGGPHRGEPGRLPRRLFKIRDGAMVGGVCNGLAAYSAST